MPWDSCLQDVVVGKDASGADIHDSVATLNCLPIVFSNLVNILIGFAGLVALIFILYSGFQYITAGGDPKQAEGARKTLTFAILGLIIILFSFFIIKLIAFFTGVECITTFGFTNCPAN